MSTHIGMSSVNISITKDVYSLLKGLKQSDESFSDIIRSLVTEKDITKCYGLLSDSHDTLKIVEKEALRARKEKWMGAGL